VYEQPDGLKPAAERFSSLQTSGWLTRPCGSAGRSTTASSSRLFSSDALNGKRNTDAIEVATGTLVAARVLEHQPAAQRKIDEVKDEIAALLQRQEAKARVMMAGEVEQPRGGAAAGVKWARP
jgi:peptidyl-prolyl cis-trans isomerase D